VQTPDLQAAKPRTQEDAGSNPARSTILNQLLSRVSSLVMFYFNAASLFLTYEEANIFRYSNSSKNNMTILNSA